MGIGIRFEDQARRGQSSSETCVRDLMSRDVTTLQVEQPLTAGIDHLLREEATAVPVVDAAGKLVGMVSYLDAIESLR
jgi:CBS-domain-containing membrane protein